MQHATCKAVYSEQFVIFEINTTNLIYLKLIALYKLSPLNISIQPEKLVIYCNSSIY